MVSKKNIELLSQKHRRYIIGTAKSLLKKFERELLSNNWQNINEGLQIKKCASPDGTEDTAGVQRTKSKSKPYLYGLRINTVAVLLSYFPYPPWHNIAFHIILG